MQFRSNQFAIPEVTKNLVIINFLFFLGKFAANSMGIDLDQHLSIFYFKSESFRPWQLVSHAFMHADLGHLIFNMLALWMFGSRLEQVWGPKRFLQFYFFSLLGAILIDYGITHYQIERLIANISYENLQTVIIEGRDLLNNGKNYIDHDLGKLNILYNIPSLGASGAVYGILIAFMMYWPDTEFNLYFILPVKVKYLIPIGFFLSVFLDLTGVQNNIGHFAHLGGALFGFLLVKYWNKNNRTTLY
ncbi:MAG: rhomboid family intramembrane serine protease [Bacteroidia bacterium]